MLEAPDVTGAGSSSSSMTSKGFLRFWEELDRLVGRRDGAVIDGATGAVTELVVRRC